MEHTGANPDSEALAEDIYCKICVDLRQMLTATNFSSQVFLSEDAIQVPCANSSKHEVIFREILKKLRCYYPWVQCDEGDDGDDRDKDIRNIKEQRKPGGPLWNTLRNSTLIFTRKAGSPAGEIEFNEFNIGYAGKSVLLLVRSGQESPGYGRLLDPEWMDLELAKCWRKECLDQHGDRCCNPLRVEAVTPTWLIDTMNNCLIPGSHSTSYVALSYRWGASDMFRTTRRSLEALRKPGALLSGPIRQGLPPTVHHAIQIVRALGERHLWVDSLCILQDDEEHLAEQLRLMGAIYHSATMTIVAADGDASDGIFGLPGISPPRSHAQKVFRPFSNDDQVFIWEQASLGSPSTAYFERGWTFQEYQLSKRRLVFTQNRMFWRCSCARRDEDLHRVKEYDRYPLHSELNLSKMLDSPTPVYSSLYKLIAQYNSRELTYPQDALPGITGLLTLLERSVPGGFLFGLPEAQFDGWLAWRSFPWARNRLKRRRDTRQPDCTASSSSLPSWSWIGWQCVASDVHEETFECGSIDTRTTPITQWYTHETPDALVRRPIMSTWYTLRQRLHDFEPESRQTWVRERYDKDKHDPLMESKGWLMKDILPPEGCGKYIYTHPNIPERYFWLPIPVITQESGTESPHRNKPQTPYISCHTTRGWFTATTFDTANRFETWTTNYEYRQAYMRLLDASGDFCGVLDSRTDDEEESQRYMHSPRPNTDETRTVELVAICRTEHSVHSSEFLDSLIEAGVFQERQDELKARYGEEATGCGKPHSYEVYRVLWVKWKDGVAYRKSAGFVYRDAWERHHTEQVHLVMG